MKAFEKQLTQYPSRFTKILITVVFLFPLWGLGFSVHYKPWGVR